MWGLVGPCAMSRYSAGRRSRCAGEQSKHPDIHRGRLLPSRNQRRTLRKRTTMKFVLAVHGTRGDVEPCATVGRELLRRGHEVRMAVPPNLVGFVESAGLAAVAYGRDSEEQMEEATDLVHRLFKMQNPINLVRAIRELRHPGLGGDEQDADFTGGRGRPAGDGPDLPRGRRQRRGVLRHSVGRDTLLPDTGQRPASPSTDTFADAPDPLHDEGGPWWLYWRVTKRP